jgi:hypothetical protein
MEGRVIQVIERAQKTVVGQFHAGPRYNYVMPFDQRIPFEIVIPDLGAVREPPLRRNRQFGGESEGRSSVGTARGQARGQDARATAGETPAPQPRTVFGLLCYYNHVK